MRRFRAIGVEAWRNPFAITVVIPRPPDPILAKWQIAVHEDCAHVIVMPHITKEKIDELVEDIARHRP